MPKIEQMFACVVEESPGDEGVPAIYSPKHGWMPLVGADIERIASLKEHIQDIANRAGKPVRVLKFTQMEVVDIFQPENPFAEADKASDEAQARSKNAVDESGAEWEYSDS